MQLQTVASKQNLKTGSGQDMAQDGGKSPNLQTAALKPKIQTSPTVVKYGSSTPDGERQLVGDSIAFSQTPKLGYQSANTPMSDRAVANKKGF